MLARRSRRSFKLCFLNVLCLSAVFRVLSLFSNAIIFLSSFFWSNCYYSSLFSLLMLTFVKVKYFSGAGILKDTVPALPLQSLLHYKRQQINRWGSRVSSVDTILQYTNCFTDI